jgi:biliverdin reductase
MVGIGVVGTGFVAGKRAHAIAEDSRARLVAVAGRTWESTVAFAQLYGAMPTSHWAELIALPGVDVVMVCHVNADHGVVALAALEAGKAVVVEYPLALALSQAQHALALAQNRGQFLHIAHVELLSGHYQALQQHLPALGQVHYARACTMAPKQARLHHWTYHPTLFGFPLVGAQSRIHRLMQALGPVSRVYCQNRYVDGHGEAGHQGCCCMAHLTFASGAMADIVYAKGKSVWTSSRRLRVIGSQGELSLTGDRGQLTTPQGTQEFSLGSRQGLFYQDTIRVLDGLLEGTPLYCSPQDSIASLQVAIAAEQSAQTQQVISIL